MRLPVINLTLEIRKRVMILFSVLLLSFSVRALMAEFTRVCLADAEWFQTGTYAIFDNQARDILDGRASVFWIDDPSPTQAAVYPQGYSLWLTFIYSISGTRSVYVVQNANGFWML